MPSAASILHCLRPTPGRFVTALLAVEGALWLSERWKWFPFEHLKGLTALKDLSLDQAPVTDAGLQYLAGLTALQSLNLMETKITGTGLTHLKGLTKMKELWLGSGTQFMDANVKDLHQALPHCRIHE
jgi:hypothetical protein